MSGRGLGIKSLTYGWYLKPCDWIEKEESMCVHRRNEGLGM